MRLSDAIALGRTLVKPCSPDTRGDFADDGCALDMAVEAIGGEVPSFAKRQKWQYAAKFWPWLREATPFRIFGEQTILFSIAFKFDRDVMGFAGAPGLPHNKPTMTLDEFIDWVRSVEPSEETPQAEVKRESLSEAVAEKSV